MRNMHWANPLKESESNSGLFRKSTRDPISRCREKTSWL